VLGQKPSWGIAPTKNAFYFVQIPKIKAFEALSFMVSKTFGGSSILSSPVPAKP